MLFLKVAFVTTGKTVTGFSWLEPRRRCLTLWRPPDTAMSFHRTASHHAMTKPRVLVIAPKDGKSSTQVLDEAIMSSFISFLVGSWCATETETMSSTSELHHSISRYITGS